MIEKLLLLFVTAIGTSSHHRGGGRHSHHSCFGVILVVAGVVLLLAGGVEATLSTGSSSSTAKTTAFAHSSKKYRNVGEGSVSLSSKSSSLLVSKIPFGGTTEDQDGSLVEGSTDDENLPVNTDNIVSGGTSPSSIIADYCRGRGGATIKKTVVGGGSASITNLIFNLVKNILGAGVLGLPAGKVQ